MNINNDDLKRVLTSSRLFKGNDEAHDFGFELNFDTMLHLVFVSFE